MCKVAPAFPGESASYPLSELLFHIYFLHMS